MQSSVSTARDPKGTHVQQQRCASRLGKNQRLLLELELGAQEATVLYSCQTRDSGWVQCGAVATNFGTLVNAKVPGYQIQIIKSYLDNRWSKRNRISRRLRDRLRLDFCRSRFWNQLCETTHLIESCN